jgi:hypothetical protein
VRWRALVTSQVEVIKEAADVLFCVARFTHPKQVMPMSSPAPLLLPLSTSQQRWREEISQAEMRRENCCCRVSLLRGFQARSKPQRSKLRYTTLLRFLRCLVVRYPGIGTERERERGRGNFVGILLSPLGG